MKLFPLTKNSFALILVALVTFGFFVAGLLKVLDYFIVKALLFIGFGALVIVAISFALKNDTQKNRPEDKLQDDSH
ncbi:hypothetical protein [Winogradskyella sp.]|uniref:hypothetical protein n=1 Tax=Winogradskyella sp. TaxID=1883156 RepID=UPI0025CBAE92|nr:hypothetical protein [Winogradskyella sp.]